MHDQQVLPDATNLNTHLRIGNVRGEERPRKRPPSAPEIPRHQGPGVLKIGVVHKEERCLKTVQSVHAAEPATALYFPASHAIHVGFAVYPALH
jgi:hypothetical protein